MGTTESGAELIQAYEADLHDFGLGSMAVINGELWAALFKPETMRYVMQKIAPWDESTRYALGVEIHTMVNRSNGTPVVAFHNVLRTTGDAQLAVFDKNGGADVYRNEGVVECRDVNLDSEENVWACLFPADSLIRFGNDGEKTKVPVSLQGFSAFAMSNDKKTLVTFFDRFGDECCIYAQHLTEEGYKDPVLLEFEPFDEETGEEIYMIFCDEYGQPSTMKDRFVLRADNRLYYYSADTLCK